MEWGSECEWVGERDGDGGDEEQEEEKKEGRVGNEGTRDESLNGLFIFALEVAEGKLRLQCRVLLFLSLLSRVGA